MSRKQMQLLNLLCEQVGIKTCGDLEEFKKAAEIKSNDMLLKRLALYVAFDKKFKE